MTSASYRGRSRPRISPSYAPAIAAVAFMALAPAACGGVSGSGVTGVGTNASPSSPGSPVGLSRCVRAHRLSSFPDPRSGPNGGGVGFPGGLLMSADGALVVDGTTFAGPALKTAEKACAKYLPPAGGPPAQVVAARKRRLPAFAACMRKHGVPNFPDPQFGGSGAVKSGPGAPASGIDPNAPAFKAAAKLCGPLQE